jgi:ATP-dependent exoDNAse (exonuclease V) alpha subunit
LSSEVAYPVKVSTIDKLHADIQIGRRTKQTLYNVNNFIIDEMSMVDLEKFHSLLDFMNYHSPGFKRLILVGDPNQLPPIGYGKVLRDIIYSLETHPEYSNNHIELKTNCRMAMKGSAVPELSSAFRYKGEFDAKLISRLKITQPAQSDGLRVRYWRDGAELNECINKEFDLLTADLNGEKGEKLNQLFGLVADGRLKDKTKVNLENFQLLTPYKADHSGSSLINAFIQETFRPGKPLEIMSGWFKQSDKVIRTKNYYDRSGELKISNGSIGIARKEGEDNLYLHENGYTSIPFREISKGQREDFDLAYCITIHKAQGSGFDHTFVILPQKSALLSRELVYTALTRAKKTVTLFIQGEADTIFEKSILAKAQRRSFTEFRKTTLLLGQPFRYYSLEPEPGVFVASRIELMIYHSLALARKAAKPGSFDFVYEVMPEIDGKTMPVKTDFTIYVNGKTYYWEHLGRLADKDYAWQWKNIKYPTYERYGIEDQLITTDELSGINPNLIDSLIQDIIKGNIRNTTVPIAYSLHHYALR